MSEEAPTTTEKTFSRKRLFVPSVAVPAFAIAISNTILNLLLLEIASTFQVHEGIAAQLRTVNAVAEVIFSLFMGFLAVRFKHKSLLLLGALLVAISAVGSFLTFSLDMLLFFFFIEGIGTAIVTIMAFTLIGDLLPLNKKVKAVSWVVTAGFVSTLVGTPLINFVAGVGGWRYAFLLLVLPVSIVGIVLALFGIPSSKSNPQQPATVDKETFIRTVKKVFVNKSAVSCLVSSLFFTGIGNALFVVAFFRQHFLLSMDYVVYWQTWKQVRN
jgi:predicted MFS family arabinose efflux permease